jgi:hypothetical protein
MSPDPELGRNPRPMDDLRITRISDHDRETNLDPYMAILELAERELELAGNGEIDDLGLLSAQWGPLTSELPAQPPPAARPLLERATHVHERTHIELLRLREALLCDLQTTAQASRAAHGYAAQARRSRRLERSA